MRVSTLSIITIGLAGAWTTSAARAADPVDYAKQIKPVLQARCYACHGALKQQAELRLDTVAAMRKGGDGGAAVEPGDEASLLLERVTAEEGAGRMPPEGEPLKPAEIAAIRAWIMAGAPAPEKDEPERDPRDHWAFRPPVRPAVPIVQDPAWQANPIDAFIAAGHAQHGLAPQPLADRRHWLRRVTLDLTGLPPTLAEIDAFLADQSPQAYETVVDRLLASPQYGERWGRHFMDVWRYSDWWGLGAEVRNSQKHMWHWRDWILDSLNSDKGYDQMVREMLAADELYPEDADRLRATGFLARQYFKFNRTSWLDETIEHTSKAFLGLTFNCAKCHDHKYDPTSHEDYYRLRAIFEPYQVRMDLVPGETDLEKDGLPRVFDGNLDRPTYVHKRGDDRQPDESRVMPPSVPGFLSHAPFEVTSIELPILAREPGLKPFVLEAHRQMAAAKVAAAKLAVTNAQTQLATAEKTPPPAPAPADAPTDAKVLAKDDFSDPLSELWEEKAGKWTYENGALVQSKVGNERGALRLKQSPPADFEARVKYIPVGGEMWKSVGISFDVKDENELLVYASSVASGSKVQFAYKSGGAYLYPTNALQARAVELNKPHELVLRVRGPLINVVLDGQFAFAFRAPVPRVPGALELITYDAKAEFKSFELRDLPATVVLEEPGGGSAKPGAPLPVDQAKLELTLTQTVLAVAEAESAALEARAAADQAKHQTPAPANQAELIAAAAKSTKAVAVAQAEEKLRRAELDAMRATKEKKDAADKAVVAAQTALEAARKALETPGTEYVSLIGSLKTAESNLESEESRRKPFPPTSTGRRAAYAKWLTDPRHPLPARVAVNHVWGRHFGKPLVATVFDFGRKGAPPTHPELLDWLAVELVENQWSLKHIHRMMVLSRTYRLSSSTSGASEQTRAADGDNRYYWRSNPLRMEAQAVRDSLLHLAGVLDLTLGGPTVAVGDDASRRRSLYYFHSHNEQQKFLEIFDDASVLECYRRSESIVPQQALALENSPLAANMAGAIAAKISGSRPDQPDADFVKTAFVLLLGAEPNADEQRLTEAALQRLTQSAQSQNKPDPRGSARTQLILALLNHNDFVTIR